MGEPIKEIKELMEENLIDSKEEAVTAARFMHSVIEQMANESKGRENSI